MNNYINDLNYEQTTGTTDHNLTCITMCNQALVALSFAEVGIKILSEGSITSEDIDHKKLMDRHFYAVAGKQGIGSDERARFLRI